MREMHYYDVEFTDGSRKTLGEDEYFELYLTGAVKRVRWSGNDLIITEEEMKRIKERLVKCCTPFKTTVNPLGNLLRDKCNEKN